MKVGLSLLTVGCAILCVPKLYQDTNGSDAEDEGVNHDEDSYPLNPHDNNSGAIPSTSNEYPQPTPEHTEQGSFGNELD